MDEQQEKINEPQETSQPLSATQKELVGDVIRKERITKRIAIETIAKDLKLNPKYIKALEANKYDELPADAYVRVYLHSISKYLMLNPETILKRFYEERGIHDEKFRKGSNTQIQIKSLEKDSKNKIKPWIIILVVIAILSIISFIAQKSGKGSLNTQESKVKNQSEQKLSGKDLPTDSTQDSILEKLIPYDSSASLNTDTATKDTLCHVKGTMTLEIKAIKDSVWLQVFSDGVSWKNWLKPFQTKRCFAKDSFNVHVGNNSLLEYKLNGKPFKIMAQEVVIFKIDKKMKHPEIWTLDKWNSVFKTN